jgi:RNA polymerase sigma factor (sigma-70 family)
MTPDEKPVPSSSEPAKPAGGSDPASGSIELPIDFKLPDGFGTDETAQLVARAQKGDARALNDLFARYHQLVVEVARRKLGARLRQKEEPDDLAQTAFREATRDFASYQYRGEGSLVSWLVRILQNKIRDRAEFYGATKRDFSRERAMQGTIKRNDEELPPLDPPSGDLSVTMQVQRTENYEHLRKALAELSPEHRQAIALVFFQGLPLRDAGQAMGGKSEDAVRMMLRRAEMRLEELLRPALGKDLG